MEKEIIKKNRYVKSIEGLRGISILAVILNHMDDSFLPSGFLGVDVFFVISGFVISKSLNDSKPESFFNFMKSFFFKRIRRIFPALLFFVFLTALLAKLILGGLDLSVVITGATSLVGLSNIYQIRIGNDYFGLGSKANFYTHTWSLGIEEQFYVILPILFFININKRSRFLVHLFILFFISIIFFFGLYDYSKIKQYYFPFSRFWELLVGVIIFWLSKSNQKYEVNKSIVNLLIICLIGTFFISKDFMLISIPTVCLLSGIIIYSTNESESFVLSNKLLTGIGMISYSLYLYHYPLLRMFNLGNGLFYITVKLLVLIAVPTLSFYLIEKPFREKLIPTNETKKIIFSIIFIILSVLSFLYIFYKPKMIKDPFARPDNIIKGFQTCDFESAGKSTCSLISENNRKIIYIGDSHSRALFPMISELHEKDKFQIHAFSVDGLFTTSMASRHVDLKMRGLAAERYIEDLGTKGDIVFLTNQLMTWFSTTYNDKKEDHQLLLDGKILTQKEAFEIYLNDLKSLNKLINKLGMKLIVTAPFPDFKVHPVTCYKPLAKYLGLQIADERCNTPRIDQEIRRDLITKELIKFSKANENVFIFDAFNLVCDKEICSSYRDNDPLYFDDDHINFNMNERIYPEFIRLVNQF